MKKDFRNAAIILPVVFTVVLFITFFAFVSLADYLNPFTDGETVASFDSSVNSKEDFSGNSICGSVSYGSSKTDIIYNADYSNMNGCASLLPGGAKFGETGCAYVKMLTSDIKPFSEISPGESVIVTALDKKYVYEYAYKFTSTSEYKIISENPDISKAMIIYSPTPGGAGLPADFTAYVFELQGGGNGT